MNTGFIITELSLTGPDVTQAEISFSKGLNVIAGPSNTGKTYIFECINYMLGGSAVPKSIPEARPYDSIKMKILTHGGDSYTLQSDLKGGEFIVTSNSESIKLARKHNPDNANNISTFLLNLNGLNEKKIRTNSNGRTRKISYRDIVKFLVVNETRVMTDKSPIISGQYTSSTEEKSTFRLILSGRDDSAIIEKISKDEIKYRKGKIELLDEIIRNNILELNNLPYGNEAEDRITKIDDQINELNGKYEELNHQFAILDSARTKLLESISQVNSKIIYNDEMLLRSKILKQQYKTDYSRLNSTIEASLLLKENPNVEDKCPVCSTPIKESNIEPEINSIIEACDLERHKLEGLINEVSATEAIFVEDDLHYKKESDELNQKLASLIEEIDNGVSAEMKNIFSKISGFNGIKSNLNKALFLEEKIKVFSSQKDTLSNTIPRAATSVDFEDISTSSVHDLCRILSNILIACGYTTETNVTYSETNNDFVISGEDRSLVGKGYRAITYASFLIALQELIFSRNYSLGPTVIDSPLVTYKKPSAQNEEIPIDIAMNFYRYLAANDKCDQVIILENEEPPVEVLTSINYIKFTHNASEGRYGFIPI